MLKSYYQLAKPGIIYGNAITAAAGFFLASKGDVDWLLFIAMLVGLSLVIGGSCVLNNYIDSDIDDKMERTKTRATVTGEISKKAALVYGFFLLLLGIIVLFIYTNPIALCAALVGVVSYVALYTPMKRVSVHSTLVGGIAGAVPPVVGYCAVAGRFDLEALILFLILLFWQMPHFYAIAIYRRNDYAAASVPVLSVKKGNMAAKIQIMIYIVGFIIASASLTVFGFAGYIYLSVALVLGLVWLGLGIYRFKSMGEADDVKWAKKMFFFSLIVIILLSIALSFGAVLP